jgi:DNA-binding protein Fis
MSLIEAGLHEADETRARALVAEGHYAEAEALIGRAVGALEAGGAAAELARALTTQGIVWARLGRKEDSASVLLRAAQTAEEAGALSVAGDAALALVEEHGAGRALSPEELFEAYCRADSLLAESRQAEGLARLRACARLVMARLAGVQFGDEITLFDAVHEVEARLITRALEESKGSVTHAAQLLGMRHQTFLAMLNTRHQELMDKRKPRGKRRRSIIKKWT